MHHLDTHNILLDTQFGFRSHHSCESQLLLTVDDLARGINNRQQIDIGILDFSKAFDKVPHLRLLHKLEHYGVVGNTLTWLTAFLSGRSQQVALNGVLSSPVEVTSGVPQGSVLGPILFLVYINDIAAGIQSNLRLFADDCILYKPINCPEDHTVLQQDLNTLTDWATLWQMEFNIRKCNILQISNTHTKSTYTYTMHGIPLTYVNEHKYLGVWMNNTLQWHTHVTKTCNKANRTLGFLQRNLKNAPTHLKQLAYRQLVLPLMDYCATIWDPYHQGDIKRLEMVQRRAARFVLNRPWNHTGNESVNEMLSVLKWPLLQARRKYLRLVLLFNVVNHLLYIPDQYLPSPATLSSTRSNHPLKFYHYQPSNDIYRYSFFPRTIPEWNKLPFADIATQSLAEFKYHLSNLLL